MRRLLIVEDRNDLCEVVAAFCSAQGYAVTIASDGVSAWKALEGEQFDGLIVDVLLPDVDGLDLARFADSCGITVITIWGGPSRKYKTDELDAHLYRQNPSGLADLPSALRALFSGAGSTANYDRPPAA